MAVKENQPQNTKSSRLLTRQDAAAYCSISVTTFDSICPIIPFALVKGRTRLCRFDKHDIDLWIENVKGLNDNRDQSLDSILNRLDQ